MRGMMNIIKNIITGQTSTDNSGSAANEAPRRLPKTDSPAMSAKSPIMMNMGQRLLPFEQQDFMGISDQ